MGIRINQAKIRPILVGVCITVVVLCLMNPMGVASGYRDFDNYSEIRSVLSETNNGKLMYFSSDNDFFEFASTSEIRKQFSADFALEGVDETLSAASFGNWSFNKYLNNNQITHILVPWSSAQRNKVVRKWGVHGSIAIDLTSPFFIRQTVTTGEFPVALYKVVQTGKLNWQSNDYKLKWDYLTRGDFYRQRESVREVGLYAYEYQSNFRDSSSVSWVMADDFGVAESPAFEIQSSLSNNAKFQITMEFLAAYGSYAPDQVVILSSENWTKSVKISSNKPGSIVFELTPGEKIKLGTGLPCRRANSFDPATSDMRQFCYGISDVTIRPVKAN